MAENRQRIGEEFEEYLELIRKVPFDQSKLSLTKFGVERHGTEWRMLRQLLLNYDGKNYDILRADAGKEKTLRQIETLKRQARRLAAYRSRVEACIAKADLQQIGDLTVKRQDGDNEFSVMASPADVLACYDDINMAKEDLLSQVDDMIFMTEQQSDDQSLGLQQTEKILIEAKEQAALWQGQIKDLLPRIKSLEDAGIGFEDQEPEYWINRFKKDIEMSLLTGGSIDAGILKSVSELPKPCQEEIIQFANRIRSETSQRGNALPVEFKSPLHAARRALPAGVDRSDDQKRLLAEHGRKVRVLIAMPRREEEDRYASDVENYLVSPTGCEFKTLECFGMPIDRARNWCIQQMLATAPGMGADWLLFVDCDVLPPRSMLMRLLEAAYGTLADLNPSMPVKEKIIAGYYTKKIRPLQSASVLYKENPDWDGTDEAARYITAAAEPPVMAQDAVIPVNGILASGAILIHRDVLVHMGEGDWFRELRDEKGDMLSTDDYHFTQKAISLGYVPKLHCGVRCVHFDKQRNMPYGERSPGEEYCTSKTGEAVLKQGPAAQGKRVLICIPRRGEFDIIETDTERMLSSKSLEWAWWNPVGQGVAQARNQAVRTAIGNGCDYLLFIDNDVIVPADIMDRLFHAGKDFVGAMYSMKTVDHRCAHILLDNDGKAVHAPMDGEGLLVCNRTVGMGCTLLSCEMLRDVERKFTRDDWDKFTEEGCVASEIGPWFVGFPNKDGKSAPTDGWGEDSFLTNQAIQCGYAPYLLLDAHCVHVARRPDSTKYYGHPDLVNQRAFTLKDAADELLAIRKV